jgi:uncharacterized membrane protein
LVKDVGEVERESDLLHHAVQAILRGGLAISVALMAVGVGLRLAEGRHDAPAVALFALSHPDDPGLTLIAFGILALALTPALRVFALVYLWARERDVRFVGVALFVIATLLVGVLLGKGG